VIEYTRPDAGTEVFRDASGRMIEYGTRWGDEGPPEDTYSVLSHPERFAPLHLVADALIAHLAATYDVEVQEDHAFAADLLHDGVTVVRAVRMAPADPDAAPLTFVFTAFPGVIVHAGLLNDLVFPDCGCDACDETWDAESDELERQVFAVVVGGFRERVGWREGAPWVETSFQYADGASTRSGTRADEGRLAQRVGSARDRLAQLTDGWHPWPRRIGA
jgi:Family of unknown function (DUF6226)